MGSTPSRTKVIKPPAKSKLSSTSLLVESIDSVESCSLQLDGVSEKGASSASFDDADKCSPNEREDSKARMLHSDMTRSKSRMQRKTSIDSFGSSEDLQVKAKRSPTFTHITTIARGDVEKPTGERSVNIKRDFPIETKKSPAFSHMGNLDILNKKIKSDRMFYSLSMDTTGSINSTAGSKPEEIPINRHSVIGRACQNERLGNDVRQVGLTRDRPGGTGYTLTYDTPKRQLPRLVPLKTENKFKNETQSRRPWEKDVLGTNNRCYSPSDIIAPKGRSWEEDVLPLEVDMRNSEKIKIKMMDLDLL